MNYRILFILHLPPPVHGASMVGSFFRGSKLINSTFDTSYINLSTATTLDQLGKADSSKIFTFIKLLLKVTTALRKKQFDLCYMTLNATGPAFYKDLFVVAILKLFRKKIIYHFHNKGIEHNGKIKLNKLLYRFVFRNTKSILLSPFLYYDIESYVKREDVYYLSNAIPNNNEIVNAVPITQEDKHPVRLLFLSNMMSEKGVFVLIEACTMLKDRKLDFECNFVGDWSDVTEDEFNKQVLKFGVSKFITSHGKKYGDDKTYFLKTADIFVFPTFYHNECFPLVLLEAMQFALPVVSTFEGGIRDIVLEGKTGFLVPQRSVELLAEKLEFLIQYPQTRHLMGSAGKLRFEELFTIQKFEQNVIRIFENALQKKVMA